MTDDKLQNLADRVLHSNLLVQTARFSHLNSEQKLAYLLAQLVEQKKETLALMEVVNIAAKECVEWKKTDEGKAWDEEMKVKREKKRESSG